MKNIDTVSEKIKGGEPIIEEGTWAFYAYILDSGKAKVLKNVHGKQVLVGALKKGDLFGEMAFLGGTQRAASVVADGDVEVTEIPKDTFMEALDELPKETRVKLKEMVSNLTGVSEICAHLTNQIKNIENMKSKTVNIKDLEKEIKGMPDILQGVVLSLAGRLNQAIGSCSKLTADLEEATNPVYSVSSEGSK